MPLLVFDLDGTLVDPLPGVVHAVAATCQAFELRQPDVSEIRPYIGPSVRGLFMALSGAAEGSDRLREIMAHYWRVFDDESVYEHRVYEGAALMLGRLKRQDHRVVVITAKPAPFARKVAHHLDLNLFIDELYGPAPTEPWPGKVAFVETLREQGLLNPPGYFIGDRRDDMRAAVACGFKALGVTWGFGNQDELRQGGADPLFQSIESLDRWLAQELPGPEIRELLNRAE